MEAYLWDAANSYSPDRTWSNTNIEFYGETELSVISKTSYELDKMFHVRTAYRNNSVTFPYTINRVDPKGELRHFTLIENDEVFDLNYWRLALQWLERSSEIGENTVNLVDLQNEVFGELRDAIGRLFNNPRLVLKNMGHPLDGDLFQFDKGTSKRFSFQNLASGEKAALDLLLDVIVTKAEWDETIFCIDEPEAHIHTKLQGQLLEELYRLISDKSQLWIATHSIGMVCKAQDLWREDPDSVVFLDFGKDEFGNEHNFDEKVTVKPAKPNPNLWAQTYEVALGDLSELVASEQYIFCEGEDFDEICYSSIFATHHPETRFVSIGGKSSVEKTVEAMKGKIAKGAKVIGVVDRDRRTGSGIKRKAKEGIRTLEWGRIEDYLLHDEVVTQLCVSLGKSEKIQEFLMAKKKEVEEVMNDDTIHDKRRPTIQRIQEQVEMVLGLAHSGDTVEDFMTDILVPLIKPDMEVYKQLHKDIFGD